MAKKKDGITGDELVPQGEKHKKWSKRYEKKYKKLEKTVDELEQLIKDMD